MSTGWTDRTLAFLTPLPAGRRWTPLVSALCATLVVALVLAFVVWVAIAAAVVGAAAASDGGYSPSPVVTGGVAGVILLGLAAFALTPLCMVLSLESVAGIRVRARRALALSVAAMAAGAVPLVRAWSEEFPPLAPWLVFGVVGVLALSRTPGSPRAVLALRAALAAALAALAMGLLDYRLATLASVGVCVPLAAAELAISAIPASGARRRRRRSETGRTAP